MTDPENVIAVEKNKTRACCKAKKQLEVKVKYKIELAELNADSFPSQLMLLFLLLFTISSE